MHTSYQHFFEGTMHVGRRGKGPREEAHEHLPVASIEGV